jgi:hypothetical protein
MATTDKNQNEIIKAWQSLIEESIKANTAFLKESSKIFTSLLSEKKEPKDFLKINTDILNAAANNYIKLNIAHTENLLNFGINVSRNLFSFNDKNNTDKETDINSEPEEQSGSSDTNSRNQIKLSAKQGEQISTSFYLNSHNAFAQSGAFKNQDFINETTGEKATTLLMSISPKQFILEPGKSLKIDVSINATNNTSPGKYKSTVALEGMDNQEFDIIIDVAENKPSIKKISTAKPVAKKFAKKSIAKKRKK